MLKILLCSGLVSAAAHAASPGGAHFDPPDLSFELELHRQFMRAQGGPSDTPSLAKDAYIENYRIQNGETLWSMSQVLYGDGNYWPRVWAQNHSITNPHLIRPGHTLQFLMGSEDDTPAFRFTEDGGESSGVELAASTSNPVIEIPPPEIPPKPVLKVPASFPEWQTVFRRAPKPILDDRGLQYKANKVPDRIYLRAFVEEEPLDPVGYFMENEREAGLPVVNQYVYIKLKKGSGHVGQKLMIAHDAGKVRTVTEEFENDVDAYLIQVAGELQITEAVPADFVRGSDRDNYDCFRALMTKTTGLSLKENALIVGELPVVDLSNSGSHGSAVAQVLGSEKHAASMLFGQGDIIFLNKGSNDGVQPGQLLDVFMNRRTRHPETAVMFAPVPSGSVKVVKVTGKLATAVVLNAHDSILQGDRVQEVSSRKGDTEKFEELDFDSVEGGEVHEDSGDTEDFQLDESDLEKDLDGL